MSTLPALLDHLRANRDFVANVVAWERIPARPGRYAPLPDSVDPRLAAALRERDIDQLYSHQAAAIEAVERGQNVVVATATASGKSLVYTLPVLSRLAADPAARALYLFPTKALAHDQEAETAAIIAAARLPVAVHTYDGDTPRGKRSSIRAGGGILITNPDMLHAGILPFHPSWRSLFGRLEYVVVDEIHTYRGVFGSHVANVLRRLQRLCRFYGSDPLFICASATIANPREHAERLIERSFMLVDESHNGAPQGRKDFILYNPPIIDEELGLRSSTVLAAKDAALTFLAQDIQTIVFARARQTVELLLTYLRDELAFRGRERGSDDAPPVVMGYRGGYLPLERRAIEAGLRDGAVRGVVATNALELGIDIGALDAAVLTGYPGTIAGTWQQVGRAGRRAARSAAVLVAGNGALDQYLCLHPRYLFGRSPEHALTNPDNLPILTRHLLCAAFELPFTADEAFGGFDPVQPVLDDLARAGDLHATRNQYHYVGDGAPSSAVSLRTGGDDTVVIQDISGDQPNVIGQVELAGAAMMVHEGAIYSHQAQTYLVERLDWEGRLADVRPVDVDYFTWAASGSNIRRLEAVAEREQGGLTVAFGEATIITQATGYRKVRRYTNETLGFGSIDLPALTLETTGYWLVFNEALTDRLYDLGILLRPNDYGPNWQAQRKLALERDGRRCRTCGASGDDITLHIHHIRPFREYGYVPGVNENYRVANQLDNLVTLCPSCHRRAELGQQTRSALAGLGYALGNLAPLFLMCDPGDISVSAESLSPVTRAPTLVVYERVPAGVGFSERLYELHDTLLAAALELVGDCRCTAGCPACVGPPGDIGPDTKDVTRRLLGILTDKVHAR
ncbi:MAG: DEAD/DEAH box helicase [Candidatus Promineofilum sp.]|uniref:DEAD/DEAH box helicase n=1 Tax=Promineifilum sp. TaxID=2664178 RepID=UPI002411F848|nr:DEAD/DEAH box helicase [Promineifilum sp.]MCO5179945.1 DEAD/DEAH box helicase [Promineifilum sp.]